MANAKTVDTVVLMSSVRAYADSDIESIETAKDSIAWLLSRRKGKDAAISSTGLGDAVGLSGSSVRDIITELRIEGVPIGSCQQGYYRIVSDDDFRKHMERFEGQKRKARECQQGMAQGWYNGE